LRVSDSWVWWWPSHGACGDTTWVSRPTTGSPDPRWGLVVGQAGSWRGSHFFFWKFFLILNLKLRVNWEFYKSFKDVKVISSLLLFNLTSNPNRWRTLQQIQILMGEIEGFWTLGSSFKSSGSSGGVVKFLLKNITNIKKMG
jgi:hypothetical protein